MNVQEPATIGKRIVVAGKAYIPDNELLKILGKSSETLRRWRRQGKAPHSIKRGRDRLTEESDLADYLKDLRKHPQFG